MSRHLVKTEFTEMGSYGSRDKQVLYAEHNNSCDIVSFYYGEKMEYLFSVEDTEQNNLMDAIKRLYAPFEKNQELVANVEHWTPEEKVKFKNR
jgi:hypothetical protein